MRHSHEFTARLDWTGASEGPTTDYRSYSRNYEISIPGRPILAGTAAPAFRGTDTRFNPEDMLVASLAACHMLSYLALCARKKIAVLDYHDNAFGKMDIVEGVLRFTEVMLKPTVVIRRDSNLERAIRLHHEAHRECFIANSVNFPVLNKPTVILAE